MRARVTEARRRRRATKRNTADTARFTPSPPDWRYLQTFVELLEDGGPATRTRWAELLKVDRVTLWRKLRTPGFQEWFDAQLSAQNRGVGQAVIARMASVALRTGSPKHAELFLRAMGLLVDKLEHSGRVSLIDLVDA